MKSTVPEIPLNNAPLVMVLSQVRFSYTPSLVTDEAEAAIHDLLRAYPVRERVDFSGPGQGTGASVITNYRFSTVDNRWIVTVAADFVAIATTAYESRADLIERLAECLKAIAVVESPARVERVGVRYVDRVEDPVDLASLDEMVRPSLLGWSGLTDTDVGSDRLDLVEESTQALLSADEDQIIVRSFRLPPNAVYDPTIPQSERQSWILDIDAGDPRRSPFSTASICDSATRLADRCHSAFRWAVTDKFIERYR